MKIKIFTVLLLLASIVNLMSCMKDESDLVSYDEAAISAFSLGTLSRTYDTKTKAGKDTTVTTTFSGSAYPFYIDQKSGQIWNPDSLPYGTKIKSALCNISVVNGGSVGIFNLTRDSLTRWQSTDSVDFSYDRGLKVYSNSVKYSRDYNVHVNVRKAPSKAVLWYGMPVCAEIGALSAGMRACCLGGKVVVYGSDGTATYAYSTTDGKDWNNLGVIGDADAWERIVGVDGEAYMLGTDGKMLRSANGADFEVVSDASATGVAKLIGGSKSQFFCLSNEGAILVSTDKGQTWNADTLINTKDVSCLPDANINLMSFGHKINMDMTIDMMIGTSNNVENTAVVWRKIENEPAQFAGWDCIDTGNEAKYQRLPKLDNMKVVYSKGYLIALGGTIDESGSTKCENLWLSRDQGLTWFSNSAMQFPDGYDTSASSWAITVDADDYVWMVFGKTGQVWRAKIIGQ